MNPALFTAAQIAQVLGVARQAVQDAFGGAPPDGQAMVAGNLANAWLLESVPERLRASLDLIRSNRGFRNIPALLNEEPEYYTPPRPLSQVQASFILKASKLRDALAIPLERQHAMRAGELVELGLSEFKRVFGYAISAKQWNRVFRRTIERDGGAGNWMHLALYVDEAAYRARSVSTPLTRRQYQHTELDDVLQGLDDKTHPTPDDRQLLFDSAFRHLEDLTAGAGEERQAGVIKSSLLDYLLKACPGLAKTPASMRRVFNSKYEAWVKGGKAPSSIRDGRELRSGKKRRLEFLNDLKVLTALAVQYGGNEALAQREAVTQGLLSREYLEYYQLDFRRNKSYVPQTIRDAITPTVDFLEDIHHGEKQARLNGPHIPRDWSDTEP